MPIHQMLSRTMRYTELPAWVLTLDDGTVVGWVESKRLRGATATYYEAILVHPETGRRVRLELSTDFHERCAVVFDYAPGEVYAALRADGLS